MPASQYSEADGTPEQTHTKHHGVYSSSSSNYAKCIVKVLKATNLPKKRNTFVSLAIGGGTTVHTKVKRRCSAPEWNEEYTQFVDPDDQIHVKVWDHGKLKGNLDPFKKVSPIARVSIPVNELAKQNKGVQTYKLEPSGEIELDITLDRIPRVAGEVHTKQFNYPTWMMDKYQINYVPPDLESWETGMITLNRYTSRWIQTQQLAISDAEGLEFDLIDISVCAHLKVLSVVVTFQWKAQEEKPVHKEITWKLFSSPTLVPKKKLYESKSIAAESFMNSFDQICTGSQQIVGQAKDWCKDNQGQIAKVCKIIPLSTPVSHHCAIWYVPL